jgi:hypothetical protein
VYLSRRILGEFNVSLSLCNNELSESLVFSNVHLVAYDSIDY